MNLHKSPKDPKLLSLYYKWTLCNLLFFFWSYGFLGASGCGKTTVLSILVGKNKLDSGELTVDGGQSDSLHGGKIGYMPQVHLKLKRRPFTFFLLHCCKIVRQCSGNSNVLLTFKILITKLCSFDFRDVLGVVER